MEIFGILNVTRDSFSDGGRLLDPEAALARGLQLVEDGAHVVDVGAASTHPEAEDVSAAEELRRLGPVVEGLLERGARVSIDTFQPEVIARAAALGVDFVNDVTALADPRSVEAARPAACRVVLMHSTSARARAERESGLNRTGDPVAEILAFFERRLDDLAHAGIARERLVVDPGMGFFLSSEPGPSLSVLRGLDRLRALGLPVLVSTSRKSFLGEVTGAVVGERGAATLASELWAWRAGADYIRTHDPQSLREAIAVWEGIEAAR